MASNDDYCTYSMRKAEEPYVFHKKTFDWPAMKWTPTYLAHKVPKQKLKFRIGPRKNDKVYMETECHHVDASFGEFTQWKRGSADTGNPLAPYDRAQYWCYADYKHIKETFTDPLFFEGIKWSDFGVKGDSRDSTFWMGSEGSYTPCHQDTYGCNIVAQIFGRKRWVLFPPEQEAYLYPTRIPYEESSVFSEVNIRNPDLNRHHLFKKSTPYVVTLDPGDVLFVPKHWWHFVESLDLSISVNMWMNEESDCVDRLTESIARLVLCEMYKNDDQAIWLNPTEELTSRERNIHYINKSLAAVHIHQQQVRHSTKNTDYLDAPPSKQRKTKETVENQKTGEYIINSTSNCMGRSEDSKSHNTTDINFDGGVIPKYKVQEYLTMIGANFNQSSFSCQTMLPSTGPSTGTEPCTGNVSASMTTNVGASKQNINFNDLMKVMTSPNVVRTITRELVQTFPKL